MGPPYLAPRKGPRFPGPGEGLLGVLENPCRYFVVALHDVAGPRLEWLRALGFVPPGCARGHAEVEPTLVDEAEDLVPPVEPLPTEHRPGLDGAQAAELIDHED